MINIDFDFVHEPKLNRNEYVLSVDYMHGDADGDTVETYTYSDDPDSVLELKQDLLGLMAFINSDAEFEDAVSEIAPIFEAQGIEDAYAVAEEWVDKFHEHDITCEDRGAAISGFTLIYYDSNGDRFIAELSVNGKKVK